MSKNVNCFRIKSHTCELWVTESTFFYFLFCRGNGFPFEDFLIFCSVLKCILCDRFLSLYFLSLFTCCFPSWLFLLFPCHLVSLVSCVSRCDRFSNETHTLTSFILLRNINSLRKPAIIIHTTAG